MAAGAGLLGSRRLLIENHVNAKRYLTWKNPAYFAALSEASLQTLTYQGGPWRRRKP